MMVATTCVVFDAKLRVRVRVSVSPDDGDYVVFKLCIVHMSTATEATTTTTTRHIRVWCRVSGYDIVRNAVFPIFILYSSMSDVTSSDGTSPRARTAWEKQRQQDTVEFGVGCRNMILHGMRYFPFPHTFILNTPCFASHENKYSPHLMKKSEGSNSLEKAEREPFSFTMPFTTFRLQQLHDSLQQYSITALHTAGLPL